MRTVGDNLNRSIPTSNKSMAIKNFQPLSERRRTPKCKQRMAFLREIPLHTLCDSCFWVTNSLERHTEWRLHYLARRLMNKYGRNIYWHLTLWNTWVGLNTTRCGQEIVTIRRKVLRLCYADGLPVGVNNLIVKITVTRHSNCTVTTLIDVMLRAIYKVFWWWLAAKSQSSSYIYYFYVSYAYKSATMKQIFLFGLVASINCVIPFLN